MSSDAGAAVLDRPMVETSYGHLKRFTWIEQHLDRSEAVLEFGCGTGLMLTLPLLRRGFDVTGIDLDEDSIRFGREAFERAGYPGDRLLLGDLDAVSADFDVIIASEVLEHIPDPELAMTLQAFRRRLRPGGRLLVTVPNGYGGCELESLLWYRLRLGPLLKRVSSRPAFSRVVRRFTRDASRDMPMGSLAASPHVQRFTSRSIRRLLEAHGFRCESLAGSMLLGGPLSGLVLDRWEPLLTISSRLGDRFPRLSIDYMLACRAQPF